LEGKLSVPARKTATLENKRVAGKDTYSIILLLEVINITIQNFNKQFNGNSSIHARIGDSESALQTLEDAFPISVELLCKG
jgi:hypothetical protein